MPILQLSVYDINGPVPDASGLRSLLDQPIVQLALTFLFFLVGVWIVLTIIRFIVRRQARLPNALKKIILLVTVPKEGGEDSRTENKDPKELLAVAETLYANLGGIKAEKYANVLVNAWHNFLYGRSDHLAFEIVAQDGLIKFYLVVPQHLQRIVELQVHAQYPKAHLEEVPDYNIFLPHGYIFGSHLGFTKRGIFPIRTYRKLDSDPLSALTNVLSKLEAGEGAAIQILLRPAGRGWQRAGQSIAHGIQTGKLRGSVTSIGGSGGWSFAKSIASTVGSSVTKSSKDDLARIEREMSPQYLTPMQQELVKALEEKSSKAGFEANIRLIASSSSQERSRMLHASIVNAFSQYQAQESGNGFHQRTNWSKARLIHQFIYRHFSGRNSLLLNAEELTSLYHFPLPTTETPNILWLGARKAPPPVNIPRDGVILGKNVFRGVETPIRISREDRRRHMYLIGITGTGKSVLMEEMAKQDILNGDGVCVVDPHGDLVEHILASIPPERADDVVLFEPSDTDRPVGLNMLEAETPEEADFAIQEMIAIFYKLFPPEMIGPMFEHNMRNVMLTLNADKESPGTIADIPRMFTDKAFQKYKLSKVTDPIVRSFWEKEMAQTSDFHKSEMLGYLISKVGRFIENSMMRNIIGQSHSGFDFRDIMDNRKILLVNLSKGKTGEVNSSLLGLIIVTKLQMAALARASMPESQRNDFYLYIDEFQNFITPSIATILSEARKYRLSLTLAHQYLGQLVEANDTKIRDAVLGTIGTLVAFRVGVEDAEVFAKQFAPVFNAYDVINIERFNAYLKLLINNSASRAFNMQTLPPTPGNPEVAAAIRQLSRLKHGRARAEVEKEILERTQLGAAAAPPQPIGERLS
jgi:hypothetical protein